MKTRDPEYDADEEYEYECLNCGEVVSAASYPGGCENCGSSMRNRGMPCE
ncbi:rubrerythrin-like domain-containing protein [Halorussus limi]|uniref:Rubrerythrin-like domain-containing protein n=1 Tax=Halorussus limi TaxID=2938695 RepID=A0A8U0HUR4_9EURY|nr:rubrerythrin-like domain-containing protein [Halorussus limi]UPV74647.1 rubrerythrin-like domain-containing protein [Halorussus limi]